ncbi:hypothetical protein M9979_10660 [Sphingomonas sp. RP10(2022)]|uniref:Hemerythrin-like domain-containing protein n=1 Tax=Sphingomonas liriopis TaxID=2949094 RepID=A0A9X2I044_9SPHN|nr:hypothetical protein [Sphingomonas liriopis]MCP3735330.1 hypothetical protein [Sphingomonas liriopis]
MSRDLHHDHDELRAIMHRFATMMAQGPDAFDASLHRDRVAFSQLFQAHMVAEEKAALIALGNDPKRLKGSADLKALFRDYSAHVSAWTPPRIKTDWHGYRNAVLALQKRLRTRMDWEEREIHPRLPRYRAA